MNRYKETAGNREKLVNYRVFLLLIVVAAAYGRVGSFDFVNWDDIVYIMNNPLIGRFDAESLSSLFSRYFMGNYHPLTMLSFSFDYLLFKLHPAGYHIHNLLLHLVNTFLVYSFFFFLQRHKIWIPLFIAMIFALHPMHVESVAWVSERKDLLYTTWFLLSLLFYLFYTKTEKKVHYSLALFFFFMSLLSKAQAVVLSPVLILLDIYLMRTRWQKLAAEKIPFLLLSVSFGIIAIHAQESMDAINPAGILPWQSFFYGSWGLVVYLFKFLIPFNQSALYHYPIDLTAGMPWHIWLSPMIYIALSLIILATNKRMGYVTFGLLFFLLTIFPVLQFFPVGEALLAERYTYIPYIGLTYAFAMTAEMLTNKLAAMNRKWIRIAGFASVLLALFSLTQSRVLIWTDSKSLWTDVLRYNRNSVTAYINRSFIYNQQGLYLEAIDDCNAGLTIDEKAYKLYINRGFANKSIQQYDLAISDFSKVLEINPDAVDAYFDRGVVFTEHLGLHQQAVGDFKTFLQSRSDDLNGNLNLAVAYIRMGKADSAMIYSRHALDIAPEDPGACFVMAVTSEMQGDYLSAYTLGLKAQQKGYPVTTAQMISWKNNADRRHH